jgi:hypothetical protein
MLLTVRTINAPWTPDSVAAGAAPPVGEHAAVFALPSGVRAPVRVDVSALLAGWVDGTTAPMGLVLATDRGEAVFRGIGSEDRHAAPHLEVVVR